MKKLRILGLISCLILLFSCVFVLSACDDVEKVTFKESDFYGTWAYVKGTVRNDHLDSVEFVNENGQLKVKMDGSSSRLSYDAVLKGNSIICIEDNFTYNDYGYLIFTMDDSKSFITMTAKYRSGEVLYTAKFCSDYSYINRN